VSHLLTYTLSSFSSLPVWDFTHCWGLLCKRDSTTNNLSLLLLQKSGSEMQIQVSKRARGFMLVDTVVLFLTSCIPGKNWGNFVALDKLLEICIWMSRWIAGPVESVWLILIQEILAFSHVLKPTSTYQFPGQFLKKIKTWNETVLRF